MIDKPWSTLLEHSTESSLIFARSERRAARGNCCIPASFSKAISRRNASSGRRHISIRWLNSKSFTIRKGKNDGV
jgi:hypothetical protein